MQTISEYLEEARHDRRLRRTTHHYVSDMIEHFGRDRVFEGVFGMEKQLDDIVAYFRAHSLSMERRLLLLVGPQGSGKSMTVDRLKRKLEESRAAQAAAPEPEPEQAQPEAGVDERRREVHERGRAAIDRMRDENTGEPSVPP